MWKLFFIIIAIVLLYSCDDSKNASNNNDDIEVKMEAADKELSTFDSVLINLYTLIEKNPNEAIIKTEKLIEDINIKIDSNNVKSNKLISLSELRTELFYKIGQYENSINEVGHTQEFYRKSFGYTSLGEQDYLVLACNYVKLREFDKAKRYIDSASKGYYIVDYILGNYYEAIGDKAEALKIYLKIKNDESIEHYAYYQLALRRIAELNKANPQLLKELYYPTVNPGFEICKVDNERRAKIFKLIQSLPEIKNCKTCNAVSIFREPKQTKSSYYWIKVSDADDSNSDVYDFYVDTLTYEIKYLNVKNGNTLTLPEWRRTRQ